MSRFLAIALGVVLASGLATGASAAIVSFDLDGAGGPTQPGFISADNTGGTDGSYTLSLSGFNSGDGRDRGTAATVQGADNNDDQVPEGVNASLYQDFYFGRGSSVSGTITGPDILAGTEYLITAFSYDSSSVTATYGVTFTGAGGSSASTSFVGDFINGPGPDPNTDTLADYSATFKATADGSGVLAFSGALDSGNLIFVNGIIVEAIPEPASAFMSLLAISCVSLLRRRVC